MALFRRLVQKAVRRLSLLGSEAGMSTAEYAVGTVAALAFATANRPTRSRVPYQSVVRLQCPRRHMVVNVL
jgi:hypothetical protein